MIKRVVSLQQLNPEELKSLVEQGYAEAKGGVLDFNLFLKNLDAFINDRATAVYMLVKKDKLAGLIAGLIAPNFFEDQIFASEVFWFVQKKDRGGLGGMKLKQTFEKWAKDIGAHYIVMGYMGTFDKLHQKKLRKMYLNTGYQEFESVFRKQL